MAEKKYGHFDDANREYVITDPKTHGLGSIIWVTRISSRSSQTQQVVIPSTRMPSSVASPVIATMVCRWITAVAISISKMAIPYGTRDGNLARHHSTATSAATA